MASPKYKRILLKLSGEALMGDQKFGIEYEACERIARAIKEVHAVGVQIGVVVGGGNIFRGNQAHAFGFSRTPADQIGMLATVINGILLHQALSKVGCQVRVMSALSTDSIVEPFNWVQAMLSLSQGTVVIFVGGTGNPYFTTDTAAALRASELNAEILFKGTKVNGIYSEDPKRSAKAIKYPALTYSEVFSKKLNVMDATAIALCRENRIPVYVFNLFEEGAMLKAICGEQTGSLVSGD